MRILTLAQSDVNTYLQKIVYHFFAVPAESQKSAKVRAFFALQIKGERQRRHADSDQSDDEAL